MKDFMFFFRGPKDLKLTPEQSQVQMQKWLDWITELTAKGHFTGGAPITKEGKIVKGTKPVVTDGPFAEGKELMGGYLMIKAESLEGATELAFGYPDFDLQCSVEVREIVEIPVH
jgi:hypothetical protein